MNMELINSIILLSLFDLLLLIFLLLICFCFAFNIFTIY